MSWVQNLIAKLAAKKADDVLGLQEGTMNDTKSWYKSKGVWTGIVTILISLYMGIDTQLGPQMHFDLPNIPEWIYIFLGTLGVYSRVVADTTITK